MTLNLAATLIDAEDTAGRTTATLVASLAARLTALHFISGADAIASLTSGFAVLGREISMTVEGARLRQALCRSQVAANGEALWRALHIADGASTAIPSPVLEQLRNDIAILLAQDLPETLSAMPIPSETRSTVLPPSQQAVTFLDFVIGYWALSRELVAAVDALAQLGQGAPQSVHAGAEPAPPVQGGILR
jgi:hypothetical protein